jgi:acetolactate synthase-1/2/3 large subunit
MSTTGPGALNMLVPLGTAYSDSSPVLSIASEIPSGYVGQEKGFFHECRDQLGMFQPVVKWAQRVNAVSAIPWTVRECFARLHSGRPRPVALEVPCDVFDSKGDVAIAEPRPVQPRGAAPEEITAAVDLLKASTRPLIWAGGGLVASGGSAALVQLAETLQAPVCTTVTGRGSITDLHPLSMGRIHLRPEGQEYLANCDLLLAVGTRFPQIETESWSLRLPETVIQIDLDSGEIGRNYPVSCGVVGDARSVLEQLLEGSGDLGGRSGRSQEVASLRKVVLEGHRKRPSVLLATFQQCGQDRLLFLL